MSPPVSVVMPVYNQERFLPQALGSILQQTERDFEFVIVDDGSTDGTRDILARLRDPRVRIIDAEHGGFIAALRLGIAAARGKWIARMDSDDVCPPFRLEQQLAFLQAHPECLFIGSVFGLVTPNNKFLTPVDLFAWRELTPRDITLALVPFTDSSAIFCRATALSAGLYDEEFDNEKPMWYRLLRRGTGVVCGEPLYYVRWRLGSHSRSEFSMRWRANVDIRRRYDPDGARELGNREAPDPASASLTAAARCVYYYLLAGDYRAANEVAAHTWRSAPANPEALKLLFRVALRRPAFRARRTWRPRYARVEPEWSSGKHV
jgi:hypothetical protein